VDAEAIIAVQHRCKLLKRPGLRLSLFYKGLAGVFEALPQARFSELQ